MSHNPCCVTTVSQKYFEFCFNDIKLPILFALSKKHYQFQQTKHHIDFGVFCISNFLFINTHLIP